MGEFNLAKQVLVEAARRLLERGYLVATGGNLSLRIPGMKAFAITPSNYDYRKMVPEDICVLGFDLSAIEGRLAPSIESALHAAVYLERPDAQAVIHTHQVYASALALMGTPIPSLFDEQARFLGRRVGVVPYAPSGTGFLRRAVAKAVRNRDNAYLMKNHGALVLGPDLDRALDNVELLEKCAMTYLLSLCAGKRPDRIPLAVREIAFAKLRKDQERAAEGWRIGPGADSAAGAQAAAGADSSASTRAKADAGAETGGREP